MTDTSLTSTLNISYDEIEGAVAKTISIDGHTSTNLRKRSTSSSDLAADWATGFLRGAPLGQQPHALGQYGAQNCSVEVEVSVWECERPL